MKVEVDLDKNKVQPGRPKKADEGEARKGEG